MADQDQGAESPFVVATGLAERVLYAFVAVLLVGGALVMLVNTVYRLVIGVDEDVLHAITEALDRLLVVFILIELLSAVSTTLSQRRLVAEPFLLVGIIATIKEVIVTTLEAGELWGEESRFDDAATELGLLTVLLLALGVTSFLVRLKEREPEE